MKNLDFKKLLVFIAIIAIVIVLIFAGMKLVGNGSGNTNKEEQEKLNDVMEDYFSVITEGHVSSYNGVDVLYSKDKTTYDDLNKAAVLNLATKYAYENGLDTSVLNTYLEQLDESGLYGDISEYTAYSGKGLRQAVLELFGEEFEDISIINESGFIYDFFYVADFDIYLVKRNSIESYASKEQNVEYKIIETSKDKKTKKYFVTVAVAYTYQKDKDTIIYASDSNGTNIVSDSGNTFPEDKINEFDKFKFTLALDDDGHYTFENVEKVS